MAEQRRLAHFVYGDLVHPSLSEIRKQLTLNHIPPVDERVLAANAEKDAPDRQLEFISNSLEELELTLLSSTEPLPKEPFDDDSESLFLRFPE